MILESGVPVLLPLYPGECNLPISESNEAEDRVHNSEDNNSVTLNDIPKKPDFIPTQVVRIGLENINDTIDDTDKTKPSIDLTNIPWKSEKENDVLDNNMYESSRALNTRVIKTSTGDKRNKEGFVREVVEPILKPHSNKIARSHDPDNVVSEISEPILGPTTAKNHALKDKTGKQMKDNFFNVRETDWVPKDVPTKSVDARAHPKRENPIEVIATTVQFLPQRLARMFEDAEKYARDTILPLVSTYTPRFISDIITPKNGQPVFVPLNYEEPKTKVMDARSLNQQIENKVDTRSEPTTPASNIQKIKRKGQKVDDLEVASTINHRKVTEYNIISTTTTTTSTSTTTTKPTEREISRRIRDDNVSNTDDKISNSFASNRKAIFIDLPVFDDERGFKYIPIG